MTKTNTIRELLDEVAQTGELPDDRTIRESVTAYASRAERTEVAQRVRKAAKRIINALDSGLPEQAAEHAAEVGEALASHTAAGADAAELPQRGWTRRHALDVPPPRSKATEPLRELLRGATRSELRAADLDALSLRKDMSDDDRAAWRAEVFAASRDIRRAYAQGDQGAARRLADTLAGQLGDALVEPEPVDPAEGIDDPRELAALVRNRHR